MKQIYVLVLLTLIAACSPRNAGAQLIESTFDTGNDGWQAPSSTWVGSGGNPGGYLRYFMERGPEGQAFSAPSKFLGDLRPFNKGVLSFDYRRDNGFLIGSNLYVGIGNSREFVQWIARPRGLADWNRVSIGLSWETSLGSLFTEEQWEQFLSNITHLSIQASDGMIPEGTDLDNVRLLGPAPVVPEPGQLALWCSLGCVAVGIRRRRRVHQG